MSAENRADIVVIGLGNVSLSDEGVARRVLGELPHQLPDWVEIVDAGLPGPGLISLLEGRKTAVIVDAVDGGRPAGTIYCFRPHEATPADSDRSYSLHQGDVLLYLKLAEALGMCPKEVVKEHTRRISNSTSQK